MKYNNILFDLDGTITEPAEGITNSVMYALRHYGIEVADRRELYKFIGPPLAESFCRYYGFSYEEAIKAVSVYREYYSVKGIFENRLYDGAQELLAALKEAGRSIYLATSKPEIFAVKILEHFNILRYFDGVVGSEMNGERTDKAEVIQSVMDRYSLSNAVMVGDRSYDVIGAASNGMACIGVLFGYGSRTELEEAGAVDVAENISELKEILFE